MDYLKANERSSHVHAAQIFRKHVLAAHPAVAATPAVDVTPDQLLDVLRGLIDAGKGRTSNKLRACVRAACQCALDVETTASIPVGFKRFAVVFNPAAQTKRSARFDRADKRPFSKEELQTDSGLIRDAKGDEAAMVRLHLLTGGQRVEQLVRPRTAEVPQDLLTIYDLKGLPGQGPSAHPIPVIRQARQALDSLKIKGEYALSTTGGEKPISVRTLAGWANDLVGDKIPGFQLKRIRSGVETLLAAKGVNQDILGHLQSHGMSGVQARHYAGHDHLPQMRQALEVLVGELEPRKVKERRATSQPATGITASQQARTASRCRLER